MSFYTQKELQDLGFKFIGDNVLISRKSSIYGIQNISIGDNSRIDDFCVLSSSDNGEIKIGKNVHIAIYSSLIGKADILVKDYVNISSRVSVYSSSDDFSGFFMTNPTIHSDFTNVISKAVVLHKHVIVGSGAILLPGVVLGKGCAVGALSLVVNSFDKLNIICGIPAKFIKKRNDNIFLIEKKLNDVS
jgi:galactoside O-acetyltransferase